MKIGRRGFLASLIAAPVLARIVGIEVARPCPQNIAYLYSNPNLPVYPLLRANVYSAPSSVLTEELLVHYFERRLAWERSNRYLRGVRW